MRPASQAAYLSPTSIYSRATSDSKPISSSILPGFQKQQRGAYFIYHNPGTVAGEYGSCDTRQLFEGTFVRPYVLLTALQVLTGEGSVEDIEIIEHYRSELPRYGTYIHIPYAENLYESAGLTGDDWSETQEAWERYESAVLDESPSQNYVEGMDDNLGSWDEIEISGVESLSLDLEDDEDEDALRGRSRTSKRATAARVPLRDDETF